VRDFDPAYDRSGSKTEDLPTARMSASTADCGHSDARALGSLVPIGDLSRCSNVQLLDHLVGKREQLVGNRQAERFGSLQIDDEGELGRLFDREVCWG
jgi:hypothetical protein